MARAISLAAAAYKLVWVRVLLYLLLPVGTTFLSLADGITDEKWNAMGEFQRTVFYVKCLLPGLIAIAAFIDSSMARAREEHRRAKAAEIQPNPGEIS